MLAGLKVSSFFHTAESFVSCSTIAAYHLLLMLQWVTKMVLTWTAKVVSKVKMKWSVCMLRAVRLVGYSDVVWVARKVVSLGNAMADRLVGNLDLYAVVCSAFVKVAD